MKRLLHTPLALLLRRIVLLYAVLILCRVVFYLYNAQLLGPLSWVTYNSFIFFNKIPS